MVPPHLCTPTHLQPRDPRKTPLGEVSLVEGALEPEGGDPNFGLAVPHLVTFDKSRALSGPQLTQLYSGGGTAEPHLTRVSAGRPLGCFEQSWLQEGLSPFPAESSAG